MKRLKTKLSYTLYAVLCLVFFTNCNNVKVEQQIDLLNCPKGRYFVATYVWYKPEKNLLLKEIAYSSHQGCFINQLDSIKKIELKKAIKYKEALDNAFKD